MRKENTLIILGVLILLVPFLGIPGTWKTPLFMVLGAMVAICGLLVRSDFKSLAAAKGKQTNAFVENGTGTAA